MAQAALTRGAEPDRFRVPDAPRPASFAARGVAVPFTTPALALSRLRLVPGGSFEIVTPNLVDGRGVYLIAWPALSEVIATTVHDRLLFDDISTAGTPDPERARLAHLRLAARGFAGLDGMAAATEALAGDGRVASAVAFALTARLIREGGVTAAAAQNAAASGRAAHEYRRALDRVAVRIGLDSRALPDCVEALSSRIAPLGLPEPRPTGRLRRAAARLAGLRQALTDWGRGEGGAYGEIADLCAEAAGHTLDGCARVLAAVDRRLDGGLLQTLRGWPRDRAVFDDARRQLAWLLDGWRRAIVLWEDARAAARTRRPVALGALFRALPLLPEEADPTGASLDLAHAHRRLMRRHCRLFDEADGAVGAVELARRLELANLGAELL
jgi:hypothetical protein